MRRTTSGKFTWEKGSGDRSQRREGLALKPGQAKVFILRLSLEEQGDVIEDTKVGCSWPGRKEHCAWRKLRIQEVVSSRVDED